MDASGRTVGLQPRSRCHGDPSLAHRAVHVFVRNRDGLVYLQRRAPTKQIQPDRWDTSVGGHLAPGENYAGGALRELSEELGVTPKPGELEMLHDWVWRSEVETEHIRTFALRHDGPFQLHPLEISEGRFWRVEELRAAAGSGELTPNLEAELQRLALLS